MHEFLCTAMVGVYIPTRRYLVIVSKKTLKQTVLSNFFCNYMIRKLYSHGIKNKCYEKTSTMCIRIVLIHRSRVFWSVSPPQMFAPFSVLHKCLHRFLVACKRIAEVPGKS